MEIKGINQSEYPVLYAIVEKNMKAYGIDKIKVKIIDNGFIASTYSLLGDYLRIPKKMLEGLNEEEIDAIVAHEFSHVFHRDSHGGMYLSLMFSIYLFIVCLVGLLKLNVIMSSPLSMLRMGTLLIPTFLIFYLGTMIRSKVSIQQEIRSDWEAMIKTKNPAALKSALFKSEVYAYTYTTDERPSLFKATVSRCGDNVSWYFTKATHPAIKERLEYLEFAERMFREQEMNMPTAKDIMQSDVLNCPA